MVTPAPVPAADRFGNPQEAFTFANAGSTGNVPTAFTANLGTGETVDNQVTLAGWVKADDWNSPDGIKYIVGLERGPTLNVSNGRLQYQVRTKYPNSSASPARRAASSCPRTAGCSWSGAPPS